jgi:hypothetical protein
MQNRVQRTLLASAARTAAIAAPKQTDYCAHGVRVYLDVTAASGTGGLKVIIRGYDRFSGNAVELSTGGTAITATGTYAYELYPNAAAAAGKVADAVSRELPVQWDAEVTAGDSSTYTYSLSCEVL